MNKTLPLYIFNLLYTVYDYTKLALCKHDFNYLACKSLVVFFQFKKFAVREKKKHWNWTF